LTHPDSLDEVIVRVAPVGVGAAPYHIERSVVGADQRRAPGLGAGVEGGDRPGGVPAEAPGHAWTAMLEFAGRMFGYVWEGRREFSRGAFGAV
jgi:hypothetical protein